MSEGSIQVVCDAGPLIHLDEVDCISLLDDFVEIFVPEQVWQEVVHHRPDALTQTGVKLTKVNVTISSKASFQALVKSLSLDLGEQAALTLMKTYPDAILLTDDAAARLAAVTLGYQVHGTVGILIRAIRRQQKSKEEILTILRDLPNISTLHIKPGLLKEMIDRVEHES
jgi:predicted nucleic acid-binding protein